MGRKETTLAGLILFVALFALMWALAAWTDRYSRPAVVFSESLELNTTVYRDKNGGLWATEWNHDVRVGDHVTLVMSCNGTDDVTYDDVIVKVKAD